MNDTDSEISVVIVDDHPLVLEGLVSRLERSKQVKVIGKASNGIEAHGTVGGFRDCSSRY